MLQLEIPETLFLIFRSFLAHDRTVPNPPMWYCYHINEFFIPRLYCYSVGIPETLLLTFHSFHSSDHLIDNVQCMLLLTRLFTTNQSSSFYFRFVYLHILFGFCFPTCWLEHTIFVIIANDVVLLFSNPRLKFCCPDIAIRIFMFQSMPNSPNRVFLSDFKSPNRVWKIQVDITTNLIPTCVSQCVPNPLSWYCYPSNVLFIPLPYLSV